MAEQPLVIPAAVRSGTRRRRLALGGALLALAAGGLAAYRLRAGEAPVAYRSVAVERRTIVRVVEATGRVEVLERVEIPAPAGPVLEIRVKVGDRVTRGQPLARLDERAAALTVRTARAGLAAAGGRVAEAESALTFATEARARIERLVEQSLASPTELASARAAEARTRAALQAVRAEQAAASHTVKSAELGESLATVASPIDGVVLRGPDPTAGGERAPLFVLGTGLEKLRLDAEVAESEIGLVRVGQRAEFTVPAHPAPFEARVEALGIDARRTGLSVRYPVELRLDNPKGLLLPGMTATVRIEVARVEGALATREAALRFRPEAAEDLPPRSQVFAVRGSTLAQLPVTAGLSDGAYTELAAGSSPEIAPGTLLAVGVRTGAEKKPGAGLSLGGK